MSNIRSQLKLNNPTITDLDRTDDTSRDVHVSERAGQRGEDLPVPPRASIPEIRAVERDHGTDTGRPDAGRPDAGRPDTDHSTGGDRDHRPVSHTPDRADLPPVVSVRETSVIEVRHADSRDGGDMMTGTDRVVERADGGSDVLIGGVRDDRFVFTAPSDSGPTREGVDQIRDFGRGDIIDLSGIDANSGARGDQTFKFIGAQEFTRDAGELHVVRDGGHTSAQRDANNDGVADFHVALMGQPNVTESNFVF